MPRQKIEFAANIPTQVELDGDGTLQASKSGDDEYRYFLASERIMWVPPEVHQQILHSGAAKGDTITIERSKPGKAAATWKVSTRDDERGNGYSNAPSPTTPPPQRMPDQNAGRSTRTAGQGWTENQPTAQAPPARPLASAPQQTAPQPAAQLAAELPITPADRMAGALRDAIELIRGCATYEPSIAWTSADVRAIAATLFIGGEKGGQR